MNANIEKFSQIGHFAMVKLSCPGIMMPFLLVTVGSYFTSGMEIDSFQLPFPELYVSIIVTDIVWKQWKKIVQFTKNFFLHLRLPFNWRTPFGYLIAFLCEFASAYATCLYSGALGNLLVSSCYVEICIVKDITIDLIAMNRCEKFEGNQMEIRMRFCDVVQLYSDAKQLSRNHHITSIFNLSLLSF